MCISSPEVAGVLPKLAEEEEEPWQHTVVQATAGQVVDSLLVEVDSLLVEVGSLPGQVGSQVPVEVDSQLPVEVGSLLVRVDSLFVEEAVVCILAGHHHSRPHLMAREKNSSTIYKYIL